MTPTERMLRACRGEPVDRPPVWLMRQAGRYLPEYRRLRAGRSFLETCRDVERAVEVSLQPLEAVGTEAVVFFSDIFVPVTAMGVELDFAPGPVMAEPLRTREQVARLRIPEPERDLPYVYAILRRLRAELEPRGIPLVGFAGAPFTLATYLVEGEGDKERRYPHLRAWMERDPKGVEELLEALGEMTAAYLAAQVKHGAQVVQLFDTWAGVLSEADYRRFLLPVNRAVARRLAREEAPFVLFTRDAGHLLGAMLESEPDVLSVGAEVDMAEAARAADGRASVQGNLAPEALALPPERIAERVRAIAEAARAARGHVMNLGHGCLPDTPVEGVRAFVRATQSLGAESAA